VVEQFSFARSGNNLILSWPADVGSYVVQTTTNLNSPIIWAQVMNPPPQLVGGQNTVTISMTNRVRFFRLQKQ
jgi:hypothetical protein